MVTEKTVGEITVAGPTVAGLNETNRSNRYRGNELLSPI